MSLIPDELKLQHFQCPNCSQYVNDEVEVCSYCNTAITAEMRKSGIEKEKVEKKNAYLHTEKQVLITGILLLTIGLFNIIIPTFDFYIHNFGLRIPCLSSLAIFIGSIITINGLLGYYKAKES